MEIVLKDINDLAPYENNPRNNQNAIKAVAESIKQFGWKVPVVIDNNNVIIAGHTRVSSARLITNSSKRDDIVADIFGGSGTTLLACEQLGRRCRMIELDPKYCDVIVKRWEDMTGLKATLITR